MTSYVTPKKNSEYIFYVSLPAQAGNTMQSNPTLASGDFKVSKDGGALANLTTLPTVTPASGKMVKITVSATEMNADNVTIVASDAAGDEWNDVTMNIHTTASQIDDLATQASVDTIDTNVDSILVDTAEIGVAGAGLTNINLPNQTMDITGDLSGSVGSVTAEVSADVVKVSGDSTSADNLELQYDGTGITGDTFPATQLQIGNVASTGAATNTPADSEVVTVGISVNSYTVTSALDGIYHEISDNSGQIDFYYEFDVGANGTPTSITYTGRLNGSNDDLDVFAYNFDTTSWEQIGNISGSNSSTDSVTTYNLLSSQVGSGANMGKVRVRGYKASGLTSATMYIDQAFLSFATIYQSVGYANGRVWVDTVNGTAGTVSFVNGTADNPVLTFADALTIASNVGLSEFNFSNDSTLTPTADLNDANIYGVGYALNLGGYDYAGTHFFHASPVNGVGTAQNSSSHLDILDSIIVDITVDDAHFTDCSLKGTVTLSSTQGGDLILVNCRSIVAGSTTPILDFGTGAVNHDVTIADYQNGLEVKNFNNSGTDRFSISGTGQLVIASTCSGTMNVRGLWKITDNSAGAVTIVTDDVSQNVSDIIVDTGTTIPATLTDIQGATFSTSTDSLEAIRDRGDSAWITADVSALATTSALATVDANVDSVLVDTGTTLPAQITALNDPSSSDITTAVLAGVIEGTVTVKQSLQLSNAGLAGKVSGAATTSVAIRDLADTKDRISATVDADGNRTTVTKSYD